MTRVILVAALLWVGGGTVGCALWPFGAEQATGPAPDLDHGLVVAEDASVVSFFERAQDFYGQLAQRRFNDITTYRDERLRDFFRSEGAFSDGAHRSPFRAQPAALPGCRRIPAGRPR
ncbi:MAG: hypothetical protein JRH01_14755 [Deltaproteobacteria bacterium]|nr:hypothetical protein [Deltaproteobacteria bacterium]